MYLYEAEEPRGAGGPKPPHVGEVVEAIGVGVAVFALGREILTSGDFSNTSSTANYMHQNTPPTQTFRKCAMEFSLKAHHPRLGFGDQTFWYRLSFEYNGNDLRNAAILALQDRSSSLVMSKFKTSWTGQPHSLPSAPVAEVMFQLDGRWDPVGRGDVSFGGDLKVSADGKVSLSVESERNWVKVGQPPVNCTVAAPWVPHGPAIIPIPHIVMFAPGSDRVVAGDERRIANWVNGLDATIKASIARGESPVRVEGFASTTGSGPFNRELSRRRANRVVAMLRDLLGSGARFEVFARGKYTAKTRDQVESPAERRVVITINYVAVRGTAGVQEVVSAGAPGF